MSYPVLKLKKGKESSILRFHPWVFSGALEKIPLNIKEGDIVNVVNSEDKVLGVGHYQPDSITVRILSFDVEEIDESFYIRRINAALATRKAANIIQESLTNTYRLVFGEGDGLSGLIIDAYNNALVMQCHSAGMYKQRDVITNALKKVFGSSIQTIYSKSAATVPFKAGLNAENELLYGNLTHTIIHEHGIAMNVNWEEGQKTGFFIDQRENRAYLAKYSKGKKVLNCFGYTGGFSMYALKAGATYAHTVDSSASAIKLSEENAQLNKFANHKGIVSDVFDFIAHDNMDYDVIVVDPPAFAKHKGSLRNALQGYQRLNALVFSKVKSGSIIFTFSCSQVVSRADFSQAIYSAALQSKRNIRILEKLSQSADHPVNIYHPEGDYLKGLILYIE